MEATISLGSNVTDRETRLATAVAMLRRDFPGMEISGFYVTPALGNSTGSYLNAVAVLETEMDAETLNRYLKRLETALGRDAAARARGDVPADFDIVMVDGVVVRPKDFAQEFFQIGYRETLRKRKMPIAR